MKFSAAFRIRTGGDSESSGAEMKDDEPGGFQSLRDLLKNCTGSVEFYPILFKAVIADAAEKNTVFCSDDIDDDAYQELGYLDYSQEVRKIDGTSIVRHSFQLKKNGEYFKQGVIANKKAAIEQAKQTYKDMKLRGMSAAEFKVEDADDLDKSINNLTKIVGEWVDYYAKSAPHWLDAREFEKQQTWNDFQVYVATETKKRKGDIKSLQALLDMQGKADRLQALSRSLTFAKREVFTANTHRATLMELCSRLKANVNQILTALPLSFRKNVAPGFEVRLFPIPDTDELNSQLGSKRHSAQERGDTVGMTLDIPDTGRPIFSISSTSTVCSLDLFNAKSRVFYVTDASDAGRLILSKETRTQVMNVIGSIKSWLQAMIDSPPKPPPPHYEDVDSSDTVRPGTRKRSLKNDPYENERRDQRKLDGLGLRDLPKAKAYLAVLEAFNPDSLSLSDVKALPKQHRDALLPLIFPALNDRKFETRREWMTLYCYGDEGLVLTTLIGWVIGGGGHGIGRADDVDENAYVWEYVGSLEPTTGRLLGELLGLSTDRYRNDLESKGYKFRNIPAPDEASDPNVYASEFAEVKPPFDKPIERYVAVNLPMPDMGVGANDSPDDPPLADLVVDLLKIFHFKYYKRTDAAGRKVFRANDTDKNPPLYSVEINGQEAVNLPLRLGIRRNFMRFQKEKSGIGMAPRSVLKHKGDNLFELRKVKRENAGSVMKSVVDSIAAFPKKDALKGSGLSATRFAEFILSVSASARADLSDIKQTLVPQLPTNQEWCHLKGHGDGGKETIGNFVSGSFHCNTEQLAIEIGQRLTTNLRPSSGTNPGRKYDYTLSSTAYLLRDSSMNPGTSFLAQDPNYQFRAFDLNEQNTGTLSKTKLDDLARVKGNAPIAAFIRYKVYRQEQGQPLKKIFHHDFEGQGEFFDKNQYRILSALVRFTLACADAGSLQPLELWFKEKTAVPRSDAMDEKRDGGGSSVSTS